MNRASTLRPEDAEDARPIHPVAVEHAIRRLVRAIDELVPEHEQLAHQAATAEHAWKLARARALLLSEARSADLREAEALQAAAAEHAAHLVAAAAFSSCTERARLLRSQLDGVRSVGASVRSSLAG